jgi:hypothetical protein
MTSERAILAILDDMHSLLVSISATLEGIESKLASVAETPSSVEVKTSTRGVDVSAKAYAGSDISPAQKAAVEAYFAALEDVQQRLGVT